MNLINDLDTEIAFAVLVDKQQNHKMESKDIFSLLGRLNQALETISKNEDEVVENNVSDNTHSHFAAI